MTIESVSSIVPTEAATWAELTTETFVEMMPAWDSFSYNKEIKQMSKH